MTTPATPATQLATYATGLPRVEAFSWWTSGAGLTFTSQVPINPNGSFELGSANRQIHRVFANLDVTLRDADLTRNDVLQVIFYLTDMQHVAELNQAWSAYFGSHRPNRAVLGVSALAIQGMVIEAVAYAASHQPAHASATQPI